MKCPHCEQEVEGDYQWNVFTKEYCAGIVFADNRKEAMMRATEKFGKVAYIVKAEVRK